MINIREAKDQDWEQIWPFFEEIVKAGDTYAYEHDLTKQDAFFIWLKRSKKTFVYQEDGKILGTYYINTNQKGPGKHVCNCGYMVSSEAGGRGIATKMCQHSQKTAVQMGYKAMQFNFVASTNVGAIGLWHKLEFETIGTLPKAFKHPKEGFVDALVMYKWLTN